MRFLIKRFVKDYRNITDNDVRERYGVLLGVSGVISNIAISVAKIVVGVLFYSVAVVADGFNNLGDAFSSLVAIIAAKAANKKADREHPFGHGRSEYVAGLIIGLGIMFVAYELIGTSIDKIKNPVLPTLHPALYVILAVAIILKLWMFSYNRYYSKKLNSEVLKAASIDSVNDAIVTSLILISVFVGKYVSFPIDGVGGLLVAALIAFNGFTVCKEAVNFILGTPASPELSAKITDLVRGDENIYGVHDLLIHNYGPGHYYASIHAEVDDKANIVAVHEIIDALEKKADDELNVSLVIHVDPVSRDEKVLALKKIVEDVAREVNDAYRVRDFRANDTGDKIVFHFDLIVPFAFDKKKSGEEIEKIKRVLQEKDARYAAVIRLDPKRR